MTAAHCIIKDFEYEHQNETYLIKIEHNDFYPNQESMYKIYLGLQNKTVIELGENIDPAIIVHVEKITVVSLHNLILFFLNKR
jgi:hypothetical protein